MKYILKRLKTKIEYFIRVKFKYIDKDFTPLKCITCKCTKLEEINLDYIDYTVTEKKVVCKECGEVQGYWAYGSYEPWW